MKLSIFTLYNLEELCVNIKSVRLKIIIETLFVVFKQYTVQYTSTTLFISLFTIYTPIMFRIKLHDARSPTSKHQPDWPYNTCTYYYYYYIIIYSLRDKVIVYHNITRRTFIIICIRCIICTRGGNKKLWVFFSTTH